MGTIIKKENYSNLLKKVSFIIEEARRRTVRQINTIITQTYWEIGRLIVEEEQKGRKRAEYGDYLIINLAKDLTRRFGRGFSERNLRNIRAFYLDYPNWHTVSALSIQSKNSETKSRKLSINI